MQSREFLEDVKAFGGLPIYLVLIAIFSILGYFTMSVRLAVGLFLAYALTSTIRFVFFRQRPDKQKFKGLAQKIDASSFPSLHAMRASCLAILLILFFNNFWITCLAIGVAVCVALVRVVQKRHFASDVIAGLIFGAIIAGIAIWIQGFLI
jgi:membrane-associated phospholipid phosphatase